MNRLILAIAPAPATALALVLAVGSFPLLAHDLYMMPEKFTVQPGAPLSIVFQNGDEFPSASSPTKPERLRDTKLISAAGTANFENITAHEKNTTATVKAPGAGLGILTARTIPNFIELDPAKFKSYLEHENLTSTLKWREQHKETNKPGRERYSKYVKSIVKVVKPDASLSKPDASFSKPTGLTIEIIPEADPYSLKPGATLPVLVIFRGKPAVDVAVESAWLESGKARMEVHGRTDSNGKIRIPIKATGPHRLHAIVMERCMERCAEPKAADWESFWASLTFAIQ